MDEARLLEATAGVATPALVVDLDAALRNARAAADRLAGTRAALRPHFKAHKCTRLLRIQVDAAGGGAGVTCATAYEAELLAGAGFEDVLLANEVADGPAVEALARAAAAARVTVAVDDPRHVALLAAAAERHGVSFEVLVEVDVGQHRAGVAPGTGEAIALARLVDGTPGLTLRGLQGYEGHAVLLSSREERAGHVRDAARLLAAEREALREAGLPCEVVSGGGTGTLDLAADAGVLDEVQAGSYVLMDAAYARLGLPYERALACRATVVSRQGGRAVLDAGLKALSAEYGMPEALRPGTVVTSLADEHATVALADAADPLAVGDQVLLVPGHVDPTLNLHPALHVVSANGTTDVWPIDGRK